MVFSALMFENLRFSTSSIFLVFAFPGMCVISILQDTHFQKDSIIYFLKLAQLCLNHFVFKGVTAYPLVLVAILGNTLKRHKRLVNGNESRTYECAFCTKKKNQRVQRNETPESVLTNLHPRVSNTDDNGYICNKYNNHTTIIIINTHITPNLMI